ncbi:hypothetical protein P43SY_000746 [Pythium insidiosum]|uniref:DUF4097 domain-containing protein n=1 Tax=Pythium insidiosum TaxID=114742 RepID=A0AAD5MIB9_PYTIN|nr:hypothetical protein P43SY_000746 [Pythium insidiosum]
MFSVSAERQRSVLQHVSLSRLAHQSHVRLQVTDSVSRIRVVPTLDHAEFAVEVFAASDGAAALTHQDILAVDEERVEDDGVKAVRIQSAAVEAGAVEIELRLPHLMDLEVSAVRGDVEIHDKIEGNVRVALGDGDIRVHKLRGEQIQLKTNRGNVTVASLIEGEQVKIAASSATVKRLMSASTEMKLAKASEEDTEIGAIYSSTCLVNSFSRGAIRVGNIHGFLRIIGEDMAGVTIGSVNGALHVEDTGARCSVDAHFDAWTADAMSKIFVGRDVRVSLDPSAPLDVELHGSKIVTSGCQFGESELDQLDDDYAIFTGNVIPSASPSSPSSVSSGKINVGSAKTAALRTSFFAPDKEKAGDAAEEEDSPTSPALPRLTVHSSSGSVTIEQLDWMAKLKRKHLSQ